MSVRTAENVDGNTLRGILDTIPALVFVERAGRIVFANAAARKMLQIAESELLRPPLEDVLCGLSFPAQPAPHAESVSVSELEPDLPPSPVPPIPANAHFEASPQDGREASLGVEADTSGPGNGSGNLPRVWPGIRADGGGRFRATVVAQNGRMTAVEGGYAPLRSPSPVPSPDSPEAGPAADFAGPETLLVALPVVGQEGKQPRLLEQMLASVPEALAITHGWRVLFVNPEFTRLFGYTAREAIGADLGELLLPAKRRAEAEGLAEAVAQQGRASAETVRRHKSGEMVDVAMAMAALVVDGVAIGFSITYRDIRESKRIEARLQHDALHDVLTGLPNRALFVDRVRQAIARRARRRDQGCCVVFLDLDKFKEVNDTLGHAAGDELLTTVAGRLKGAIRPQDTAARLGGDEFALLLESVQTVADVKAATERLYRELRRPVEFEGKSFPVGVSIGVALCGPEHDTPEQLLRDADFAMYRAKEEGGSRVEIFDQQMQVQITTQQERERELREVMDRRDFEFWYQPVYRVATGELEEMESLLRWRRRDGSFASFRDLLALADDTGLSTTLGRETVEQTCRRLSQWQQRWPGRNFLVGINVTPRQFFHIEMDTLMDRVLAETGVDPARLLLEVPEIALNENPDGAVAILQRLADRKIRIAVDNFGSGLAPINHLVRLPVDVVKLDPKFTASASLGGRHTAILSTMIDLGRSLGVEIVAQGVELHEQFVALRELGCDLVQGHLFASAVASAEAEELIALGEWSIPAILKAQDTPVGRRAARPQLEGRML